jgi:general secretion pathway protein D
MQTRFHSWSRFVALVCAGMAFVFGAGVARAVPEAAGAISAPPMASAATNRARQIILHFQDAPLESVLEYFAEAAGYNVSLEARAAGKVNVISDQPVTVVQALDLLNTVLKQNNLAAIRDGTNLTVINRDEAKARGVPVRMGSDAAQIPRNDEVVTQIMPLRFVTAADALKAVSPMMGASVTATANESANLLVVTDTQAHIHRLAEILSAMDADAAGVTVLKVFHLQNADAEEMADLLTQLFGSSTKSSESQAPFQMPGPFPGGGGPPFGPGAQGGESGGSGSGNGNERLRKVTQVTAVADARTASVVVSASRGVIAQIQNVIAQLDASAAKKKRVAVYRIEHGSPRHVAQVLQALFSKEASGSGGGSQNSSSQSDVLESRATQLGQEALSAAQSASGGGGSSSGPGGGGQGGGGGMPQ